MRKFRQKGDGGKTLIGKKVGRLVYTPILGREQEGADLIPPPALKTVAGGGKANVDNRAEFCRAQVNRKPSFKGPSVVSAPKRSCAA